MASVEKTSAANDVLLVGIHGENNEDDVLRPMLLLVLFRSLLITSSSSSMSAFKLDEFIMVTLDAAEADLDMFLLEGFFLRNEDNSSCVLLRIDKHSLYFSLSSVTFLINNPLNFLSSGKIAFFYKEA